MSYNNNQQYVTKRNVGRGKVFTILKKERENSYFPCPLCNKKKLVKYTKKLKPYLVCNHCGVQLFVRKTQGILELYKKFKKQS